jgi:hypothetical protein
LTSSRDLFPPVQFNFFTVFGLKQPPAVELHLVMTQTASSTLLDRSRLVRLLTNLSEINFSSADYNLAEHLGRMLSVSDSISLSRSLAQLPEIPAKSIVATADAVKEDVLASREQMMRIIVQSFAVKHQGTGIQVPSVSTGTRAEALETYEPYQRFYNMHQAEMAGSSHSLRLRVRAAVSGFSVELHQLAELDRIIGESLSSHTAKLLNVTPKLLRQRFKQLLAAHRLKESDSSNTEMHHWLSPGGWLELFYRDMQELLLAELDVRLQPTLGLLEALYEYTSNTTA